MQYIQWASIETRNIFNLIKNKVSNQNTKHETDGQKLQI